MVKTMGMRIAGIALGAFGWGYGQITPVVSSDSSARETPMVINAEPQFNADRDDFSTPKPSKQGWGSESASVPSAGLADNLVLAGGTAFGGIFAALIGGSIASGGCNDDAEDADFACLGNVILGGFIGYHVGAQLSFQGIASLQKRDIPMWAPLVYSLGHQVLFFSAISGNHAMAFFALNPLFMVTGAIIHERTGFNISPTASVNPKGEFAPGLQVSRSF